MRNAGVPIIFVRNIYMTDQNWYLSDVSISQVKRSMRGLHFEVPHCKKDTASAP